jgi:signal peptidase complex subunit 2
MQSLGYTQSHTLSDVRLAMGYGAVIAVAAAAYYEYKVGFQEAKVWTTLSVGSYFLLQAALYLWTNYIERDTIYVGKKANTTVFAPFNFF